MNATPSPMFDDDPDYLMTTIQLAEYTGIPWQTFELLRLLDIGPRSVLAGNRVKYHRTEADDWRARRTHRAELKAAINRVLDELLNVVEVFDQVV